MQVLKKANPQNPHCGEIGDIGEMVVRSVTALWSETELCRRCFIRVGYGVVKRSHCLTVLFFGGDRGDLGGIIRNASEASVGVGAAMHVLGNRSWHRLGVLVHVG